MSGEHRRVCCKLCYADGKEEEDCIIGLQSFKNGIIDSQLLGDG